MKRMVATNTTLYSDYTMYNVPVREIIAGETLELGNVIKEYGEWIEVLSERAVIGYIQGDTPLVNLDKYCYVNQEFVNVYSAPDTNTPVERQYRRGDEMYLVDKLTRGTKSWYKIFDATGKSGYIETDVNLKNTDVSGKSMVLNQDLVEIHKWPKKDSDLLYVRNSGVHFTTLQLVKDAEGKRWFQIRTADGEGYIEGNTRMLTLQEHQEFQKMVEEHNKDHIDPGDKFGWERWLFYKGSVGGAVMTAGGLIWLYAGYYLVDRIYIYPFVLMVLGLIAIVKDLIESKKDIRFAIKVTALFLVYAVTYLILAQPHI